MADYDDDDLISDLDTTEDSLAVENRKNFEAAIAASNLWGHSSMGLEAKQAAMTMLSTKTGLYARIPLICKADSCPYAETCPLLPYDLAPEGEYCPQETAQIEMRAYSYSNDIDIENASFTDKALLNEIIGLDIMLERCRALMAKEGTPVIEVVAGISDHGDEIRQPVVSKAWEAYEKISKKRNTAYQLMMMTRKDNKDQEVNQDDALSEILAKTISVEDLPSEE